jgi:hypothetical protein
MIIIFKYKPPKTEGEEGIFKARCCLLGNRLDKTASSVPAPTPRMTTVRMVLSMAAKQQAHVMATDVSQAFLNAQPREYNMSFAFGFSRTPIRWQAGNLMLQSVRAPVCTSSLGNSLFELDVDDRLRAEPG